MSSADYDVTPAVRSWVRADEPGAPAEILASVLAAMETVPQRRSRWPASVASLFSSPLPLAVATTVVVAVTAITIGSLSPGSFGDPLPPTTASPSASTPAPPSPGEQGSPNLADATLGLPPEGTEPSSSEPGELVAQIAGSLEDSCPGACGAWWSTMWIYADGRLVWHRYPSVQAADEDGFVGFVEQRLTPAGVEFLRSSIIGTGLFERDLSLARERNAPFFEAQVMNGGQFVRVTWAVRDNYKVGPNAPVATTDQADALSDLYVLLVDQDRWPDTAWADETPRAYVPAEYEISFRLPDEVITAEYAVGLLPQAAQDLLHGSAYHPPIEGANGAAGSYRMSTDDARVLARLLASGGLEHPYPNRIAVRYFVRDPERGGAEIWISFSAILPHGEAVWLGSG